MKKLFSVFLVISLLSPSLCLAELLIYKGSMKIDHAGGETRSRQSYKAFIVIDPATGEITKIDYFAASQGLKLFTVQQFQGFHSIAVISGRGKTNTVVAQAETSFEQSNQVTVTSTFLIGANSRLTLSDTNKAYPFPTVLDWRSRGVSPSFNGDTTITWEETGVVAFDKEITSTNNNSSQVVSGASLSLGAGLRRQGYQEVVPK